MFAGGFKSLGSVPLVELYGESRPDCLSLLPTLGFCNVTPRRPLLLFLACGPGGADIAPVVEKATTSLADGAHQGF